jgi:hypothetical protein
LLPVHHSGSCPAPQGLCGLSVHQACGQGLPVTLLSCTILAHLDAALAGLHPCARLPSRLSASSIRCGPGGTCYQTVGSGSTSQPRWTWLCLAARPRGPWPLLSPPALRLLCTQLQAVQRTFSRAPRHSLRACCGARAPGHLSTWRCLTVPPALVLDLLVNAGLVDSKVVWRGKVARIQHKITLLTVLTTAWGKPALGARCASKKVCRSLPLAGPLFRPWKCSVYRCSNRPVAPLCARRPRRSFCLVRGGSFAQAAMASTQEVLHMTLPVAWRSVDGVHLRLSSSAYAGTRCSVSWDSSCSSSAAPCPDSRDTTHPRNPQLPEARGAAIRALDEALSASPTLGAPSLLATLAAPTAPPPLRAPLQPAVPALSVYSGGLGATKLVLSPQSSLKAACFPSSSPPDCCAHAERVAGDFPGFADLASLAGVGAHGGEPDPVLAAAADDVRAIERLEVCPFPSFVRRSLSLSLSLSPSCPLPPL